MTLSYANTNPPLKSTHQCVHQAIFVEEAYLIIATKRALQGFVAIL